MAHVSKAKMRYQMFNTSDICTGNGYFTAEQHNITSKCIKKIISQGLVILTLLVNGWMIVI